MIETERLLLREYTPDDFASLYEILSDAETMAHYPMPFDEARTRRWMWIQHRLAGRAAFCILPCGAGSGLTVSVSASQSG
ncbi:MAG: GNAT family N-acetyltransferase [Clostridiales bacterium]|nr:GNAT family N-acetyltransferase [Clostridiales bacterium]